MGKCGCTLAFGGTCLISSPLVLLLVVLRLASGDFPFELSEIIVGWLGGSLAVGSVLGSLVPV